MKDPSDPAGLKSLRTPAQADALSIIQKLVFAVLVSSAVLLGEKLAIQIIAQSASRPAAPGESSHPPSADFHERSYAERISDQKAAVRVLVTLYVNSSEVGCGHCRYLPRTKFSSDSRSHGYTKGSYRSSTTSRA